MGLAEIAVIAFIAVLVFGPERLPELARQLAGFVRKARSFATSARDELRDQLGPEYADLELTDLDPRTFIRRQIEEAMADLDEEERRRLRSSARRSASEREDGDDADPEDEDVEGAEHDPDDEYDADDGDDPRYSRRGNRPLGAGELPPYDVDAT